MSELAATIQMIAEAADFLSANGSWLALAVANQLAHSGANYMMLPSVESQSVSEIEETLSVIVLDPAARARGSMATMGASRVPAISSF